MSENRPNFILLLGLEPRSDWTDEQVEEAIARFKMQLIRDEKNPRRAAKAAENRRLLPELQQVMRDPARRAEEAVAARAALQRAADEAYQEAGIYTAKGFLTPKEFEDLVNRYAPRGVSREALQRLFSGTAIHPPQPFFPLQPAQPYPQREELERWLEEQNYPYLNLYEFLGVQPPATPEELLARVEQKDREILQAVAPTPELLAERTLCAICRRTFADAQTLAGYNLYFYGHPLPQISIMVCRQGYANGGHITSAMHQALIRSALQTYSGEINAEDAALCVQRVAEAEGFRLDPLPAEPAPPQPVPAPPAPRPLSQPAPPPAPAGEFREEDLPELLPLPFGRMPEMPPLVFPSYPAQDVQVDRVYEVMKLASQSETDHRENLEFLLQRFPQHPKVLLLQLSFEAGTGVRMEELYTSSLDITQCPSWQQAYAANPQNREFLLLAAAYSRRNAREKKLSAPVALAVTAGYVLLFVLRIVPHLTEWMNQLNTSFLHMVVFLWPVLPHSLSMGLCTRLNRQGSRLPGVLRILFGGGLWGVVAYQVVRSQRVFSLSWVAGFLAFLLFFGVLALSDAVPGLAVIGRSRIAVPQRSRRAALGGIVLLAVLSVLLWPRLLLAAPVPVLFLMLALAVAGGGFILYRLEHRSGFLRFLAVVPSIILIIGCVGDLITRIL